MLFARSEISKGLFTFEQPKRNKTASRFPSVSEEEIISRSEETVSKLGNKFGLTVLNAKWLNVV